VYFSLKNSKNIKEKMRLNINQQIKLKPIPRGLTQFKLGFANKII
jgi:hypothetical protein